MTTAREEIRRLENLITALHTSVSIHRAELAGLLLKIRDCEEGIKALREEQVK